MPSLMAFGEGVLTILGYFEAIEIEKQELF